MDARLGWQEPIKIRIKGFFVCARRGTAQVPNNEVGDKSLLISHMSALVWGYAQIVTI